MVDVVVVIVEEKVDPVEDDVDPVLVDLHTHV